MRISVIGGGNIGTLMAAEFAAAGHEVVVCASRPEEWSPRIEVLDQDDGLLFESELSEVTSDLDSAVGDADIVWITYPTFMLPDLAARLLPNIHAGQFIGVVPGNDAEFFFSEHIARGAVLFGLQRVHSIARLKQRGKSVYMLGRKPEIQVAALPASRTREVASSVEGLFQIETVALPNYLVETLTPSNPILHTTRIRSMFRDWEPGKTYDRNILFYEEWDIPSAELLLECDEELQRVCRALESRLGLDLSLVKPLSVHYESQTAEAMQAKISGIPAFRGLASPMKETSPGRWAPDFESRYFKADFAYGLRAIRDISALAGVPVPHIDEVLAWYERVSGNVDGNGFVPGSIEELGRLYA